MPAGSFLASGARGRIRGTGEVCIWRVFSAYRPASAPRFGDDVVDWVIGRPLGEDQKVLMEALDRAGDAAEVLISQGPDRAMNRFN